MAIVRTTPKETNAGGPTPNGSGTAAAPLDRTKSVVQQTAAKAPVRQPGGRPMVTNRAQVPVKTGAPSTFLNDTIAELRRVVWPTKAEVQAGSIVTIGLLIFFAAYIFGLDFIVHKLFQLLGLYPT